MSRRFPTLWLAVVVLIVLVSARTAAGYVVDALWVVALGQPVVVVRSLAAQVATGLLGAVAVGLAVGGSGAWAMQHTRNRPIVLAPDWRGTTVDRWFRRPDALERTLRNGTVLAALFAATVSVAWADELLTWWHHVPFGRTDPVLGQDLSFYVYTLPLLRAVRTMALVCTVLAMVVAAAIYVLRGAITVVITEGSGEPTAPSVRMDAGPRRHLALLAMASLLLVATNDHLTRFAVLQRPGMAFDGPGFVEVFVVLPLLTAQAIAGALAAGLAFQAIDQLRRPPALAAVGLIIAGTAMHLVVPPLAEQVWVEPDALVRQAPLVAAHVQATQAAWGLDGLVTMQAVPASAPDRLEVEAVRVWERGAWLDAVGDAPGHARQLPGSVLSHVTVDRELRDGRLVPVLRSAWQAAAPPLADPRSWTEIHVTDTHGRGMVQGLASDAGPDGAPLLDAPDPNLDAVDVYFGTSPTPHALMTPADGPAAGALVLGGTAHRALLALALGDGNILLSQELGPQTHLLLHRDVVERVRALAPFLWWSDAPALVPLEDRLVWLVEGATTTDMLPFSARRRLPGSRSRLPVNGAHHAVTAVVDATTGAVTLYQRDADDPLLATWMRAFPGLVQPADALPDGLRDHLRPMPALAALQGSLIGAYHDPAPARVLAEDATWKVPEDGDDPARLLPSLVKAPGESEPAFRVVVPLTAQDGDVLAGWLLVRDDSVRSLVLVTLPASPPTRGPRAVGDRILDDGRAQQAALVPGGQSTLGPLRLVPDGPTPWWVQVITARALQAEAPARLHGVVVATGDRVGAGATLTDALGGPLPVPKPVPVPEDADVRALIEAAKARYDAAVRATAAGRWAEFGEAFEALGGVLERLDAGAAASPASAGEVVDERAPAPSVPAP